MYNTHVYVFCLFSSALRCLWCWHDIVWFAAVLKSCVLLADHSMVLYALRLLLRAASFHPSVDEQGNVLVPAPKIKRLLSSEQHFPHIVQLLLCKGTEVINAASGLLQDLVERNLELGLLVLFCAPCYRSFCTVALLLN